MKSHVSNTLLAVCASAFIAPSVANAQDVVVTEEASTVTEFSCDNKDRYTSNWRDNWFIQIGAGVNQPVVERGVGITNGKPIVNKKIITTEYNVGVGRWMTPFLGFRLNALGGVLHWDNPTPLATDGRTRANHVNLNLELMWDMCNSIAGVNSNRPFSVIPFVGVGGDFMWNMKSRLGGYPVASNILDPQDNIKSNSWTLPVSAGVQFRVRLCEYVDFFAEARAAFYGDNWNGCAYGEPIESNVSALGGFNFNIGGREWGKYNECYSAAEIASLNGQVNNLRSELLAANQALAAAVTAEAPVVTNAVEVDCPEQPLLATVRFKINSSEIQPQEEVNVYNMAQYLKNNPDVNISVVGFADKDTGSAAYNQALSVRRAQAVADSLVKKYGVASNRIEVKGEGSSEQPYPANNDWNRIVIFVNK